MTTDLSRRHLLAAGAALALPAGPAWSQAYPNRPITLIIPYGAGGPTDIAVRAFADEARKALGQAFVIENRAGANGTGGGAAIARAQPDGYTLAVLPATAYREPHINKVQFDPLTSFTYIALLTDFVFGFVVRADSPWKNFADFAAEAKRKPGMLNVGSGGGPIGSPSIAVDEMADAAGIKVNSVPFKGDADVTNAMLGGHIDAAALSGVAVPHIEAGRLRYIAAMTEHRIKRFPQVPTLREQGVAVSIDSPYGIAGPKGMDAARVSLIAQAFKGALESPQGTKILDQLNQEINYKGPDEYSKYAEAMTAREKLRVAKLRESGRL